MRVHNVVGGQFGSEAKGHVAARIARDELTRNRQVVGCRVAGPNAGHTAYSPEGTPYALRQIPVMAVVDPSIQLAIGPGSEIDLDVLNDEIAYLEGSIMNPIPVANRLTISGEATVLTKGDIQDEKGMHERMGSTGKGVGAARAARIMRTADTIGQLVGTGDLSPQIDMAVDNYDSLVRDFWGPNPNCAFIIEGTQGFGLGLHAGYYPYCTSSDCRNVDFMAMAGVSPWGQHHVTTTLVCRTFPIRVAGNSGPMYNETSWEHLGAITEGYIRPEFTTVTKKMRRVGWWDDQLVSDAIAANGGPDQVQIALTFVDYIDPEVSGVCEWSELTKSVRDFVKEIEVNHGVQVSQVTTGPNSGVWLS
jgi:adenylosuccinate synthase